MGSVVDSLKRLYRKIGGGKLKGPIAVDDLVDKIADQMSSGSGSGSNQDKFVINILGINNKHLILDKTFDETAQYYTQHGNSIYLNFNIGTDVDMLYQVSFVRASITPLGPDPLSFTFVWANGIIEDGLTIIVVDFVKTDCTISQSSIALDSGRLE